MSTLERSERYRLMDEAASLADDPWELLQKLARETPLLTREEEVALGQRIRSGINCEGTGLAGTKIVKETPDSREALDQLVTANLKLVLKEARTWEKWGDRETLLRYAQQGILGLTLAALKFDPDRGFRFATAATFWVKRAVKMEAAEGDGRRLPGRAFDECLKVRRQLEIAGRTSANESEAISKVAKEMGMNAEKVRNLLQAKKFQVSLQELVVWKDRDGEELGEKLSADNEPTEKIVMQRELAQLVKRLLEREDLYAKGKAESGKLLLLVRTGLAGKRGLTLEETGKLLGITKQAVSLQEKDIHERAARVAQTTEWRGQLGQRKKEKKPFTKAEEEDLVDLSEPEKRAVKLVGSGLKIKEVAQMMGLTENQTDQLLNSARAKRQIIQEGEMVRTVAAGMMGAGRE